MPDINMQVFEEAKRNQLVTEIDIQTQVALDDYQVQLSDIANPTQSQDNVIIDRFCEFLPHWNESLDFDTWVKISMEVAGKRLLMLRGNSSVGNESSGSDAFIQYHGAYTGDYLDTLLVTPTNIIYESRAKLTSTTNRNIIWGLSNVAGISDDMLGLQQGSVIGVRGINTNEGATSVTTDISVMNVDQWYRMKAIRSSTNIIYYRDTTEIGTVTTNIPDEKLGLFQHNFDSVAAVSDWAFARKYTATEPTHIIGTPKNIAVALKSLGRAG